MPVGTRNIVITGMGAVSSCGKNVGELWHSVLNGVDGIRPITRFSTQKYDTHLGGLVAHSLPPSPSREKMRGLLCDEFSLAAAAEALERGGFQKEDISNFRIGFVLGTGLGDEKYEPHPITERLATKLFANPLCVTVCTACSSSTNAIGLARELLLSEQVDIVLAGGVDVLLEDVFAGFYALGVLSKQKCAPFSTPVGTTLGEGAGFLLLEPEDVANKRNAKIYAYLTGYGSSADAYHETSPDPSGKGIARAMGFALRDAGLSAEEIGYINAHGSGTDANDPAEWRAVCQVFEHPESVAISSTKSILGHAQGAAGVLEIIVTILAMNSGWIPQTMNFKGPRKFCFQDPVGGETPRRGEFLNALCTNSAFGGANASVVISKSPNGESSREGKRIYILGIGAAGPFGLTQKEFLRALVDGARLRATPDYNLQKTVKTADTRSMDTLGCHLTFAVAKALKNAGILVRGSLREQIGLIAGLSKSSTSSVLAFNGSIESNGFENLSAKAFSKIVINAPTGSAAKLLSIRGPCTTVSAGKDSGLFSILYAAGLLRRRWDAKYLIAGGADELAPCDTYSDGACMAVLGTEDDLPSLTADVPGVELARWSVRGGNSLHACILQVCEASKLSANDIQLLVGYGNSLEKAASYLPKATILDLTRLGIVAHAMTSACAFAAGVIKISEGSFENALVVSAESKFLSLAAFLKKAK